MVGGMRRLALFAAPALLCVPAALASPQVPGMKIDCAASARITESARPYLSCTCPSANAMPVCTTRSGGAGAGRRSSGAMSNEAFAAQMLGDIVGQALASLFAPPRDDSADIAARKAAQEAAKRQFEAQQQQLRDLWKEQQAQAQRRALTEEDQRRQDGAELLAKMHGEDGPPPDSMQTLGGTLEGFKWDTGAAAKERLQPLSGGRYDTSGLKAWQRLLCASYFSENAAAAMNANPEQAHYLDEQAARVAAGQAVDIPCKFPAAPAVPDPSAPDEKTMKAIQTVQLRLQDLQGIETKLRKTEEDKKGAEEQARRAEEARAQAEADKDRAKPEDAALMAEIERRLAEAQAQLAEADRKLRELADQESRLLQEKDAVRQELQQIQREQQQGSATPRP